MMPNHPLGPYGLEWAENRSLDVEVLSRFGIFTARRVKLEDGSVECRPDINGQIIAIPYLEGGHEVAQKWRAENPKRFLQRRGGKKTFWNADALDAPELATGEFALIVTEGEPDALAAITAGYSLAVSCPDGAPPVPKGRAPADLDPLDAEAERVGKFEYIWNNRTRLQRVKRFILATDNDPAGRRLEAELLRRLSPARCMFVTYPDGCKDANDVLVKHGIDELRRMIDGAQPYPVRGLYRLTDYREGGALETLSTGWSTLDGHLRLYAGEFMVITGIPGHGKSAWVNNLLVNMARLYGWRSAVMSAEMPVVPMLRDNLRRMVQSGTRLSLAETDEWISSYFVFIDSDPFGEGADDPTLEWVIERATDAVLRDGIRILVIDPWNELEHACDRGEMMVDYIGRAIRQLKRFARRYGVAVIVVAHPTKNIVTARGEIRKPSLYDIESAAHWFNKADHGVIVWRDDATPNQAEIIVAKSRFAEAGVRGSVKMQFNVQSSRFDLLQVAEGFV